MLSENGFITAEPRTMLQYFVHTLNSLSKLQRLYRQP